MQIDITALIEKDQFPLSHSIAEGGSNAGQETWRLAMEAATETTLLDTPEKLEAMRDFARSSGGWTRKEIDKWTRKEVNALFLQLIAGDVRQCPRTLERITFDGGRIDGSQWYYEREEDNGEFETGPFESRSEAYQDACPQGREPRAKSLEEIDWPEYETQAHDGQISGNLYRADDGRIFFSLCD